LTVVEQRELIILCAVIDWLHLWGPSPMVLKAIDHWLVCLVWLVWGRGRSCTLGSRGDASAMLPLYRGLLAEEVTMNAQQAPGRHLKAQGLKGGHITRLLGATLVDQTLSHKVCGPFALAG
jgi:hypothetical protein